jgi:threonine dehydrogenase-like Zn-dependent dehydrogenase
MKAVTCQNSKLELVDRPDPQPGPGQVVLNVLGCGICGSDLHVRYHADAEADVLAEIGYGGFMRSGQPVVLGHEFVGEVAGYGPGTGKKPACRPSSPSSPSRWRSGGTRSAARRSKRATSRS